jgi:hypothetical protein
MTTEAYELPPMNPVPAMSLDQFRSGELAVSTQACRNYAALYGQECARLAVKQERERAAKVPESLNRPDELRLWHAAAHGRRWPTSPVRQALSAA